MMFVNCDDRTLITKYISGEEKAFEVLLLRHKDRIYRSIQMKVRDEALANDLFQDAFIKIINTLKAGNYNEEGKFLPWALRIAQNLVIDHFRKSNKVKMISESSSLKDDYNILHTLKLEEGTIEQQIGRDELEGQVVELIDHLPESQREILKLRIYNDMSFKDIAELYDISINTALGRMRYALINLRKLMEKYNVVTEY
ncbi:MAG: sigma-70 family RNA polymerase sigma factor [Bacteroidetes bacterium]|nr:MAG: sigma-70 family RNA polymerase sigma factor [Bacteroidota bacterium]